jgi:hypothetical protein
MQFIRKNGAASNVFRVMLRNSTTGAGLTGLTEASPGLIIATICDNEAATTRYRAGSGEIETIATLGTFAAPTAGKCRFKEVDATNHSGLYEIQLDDARFGVSGAKVLRVCISGATSLITKDVTFQLSAVDLDNSVRMGMTALPNASAGAISGLPTLVVGPTGENPRLSQPVAVLSSSQGSIAGLVVVGILSITKAAVAALDPTLWFRFAHDKLSKIGTAAGTVQGPVGTDSEGASVLYLTIRDDFTDEDGQPIEVDLPEGWEDISAVPITDIWLGMGPEFITSPDGAVVVVNATEIVASGVAVTQTVKFEPREADTGDLKPDDSWKATVLVDYGPGNRRSFNLGLQISRTYVP